MKLCHTWIHLSNFEIPCNGLILCWHIFMMQNWSELNLRLEIWESEPRQSCRFRLPKHHRLFLSPSCQKASQFFHNCPALDGKKEINALPTLYHPVQLSLCTGTGRKGSMYCIWRGEESVHTSSFFVRDLEIWIQTGDCGTPQILLKVNKGTFGEVLPTVQLENIGEGEERYPKEEWPANVGLSGANTAGFVSWCHTCFSCWTLWTSSWGPVKMFPMELWVQSTCHCRKNQVSVCNSPRSHECKQQCQEITYFFRQSMT